MSDILIVGDVMLDEYLYGTADRLAPEAPVPVVRVTRRVTSPGGAGNVAANVRGMEGVPFLVGVTGQDAASSEFWSLLGDAHAEMLPTSRPTTVKSRLVSGGRLLARWDTEVAGPSSDVDADRLIASCEDVMDSCTAVVVSDYGKGVVTPRVAEAVIWAAAARNISVVVDPKGKDYQKYTGCTVIKPNVRELSEWAGERLDGNDEIIAAAWRLAGYLGGAAVLVTRGADGMTLVQPGAEPVHIPAVAISVADVTGAGDTVVAALAVALTEGASLLDAATWANAAAGVAVSRPGTVAVRRHEIGDLFGVASV